MSAGAKPPAASASATTAGSFMLRTSTHIAWNTVVNKASKRAGSRTCVPEMARISCSVLMGKYGLVPSGTP